MKLKLIYILFIAAVLFLACERPPLAEMESAREAVFRAENDADAALYAADTLIRARSALVRMQFESDSKRYNSARTLADEAITAAERALIEGRAAAQRAAVEGIPAEAAPAERRSTGEPDPLVLGLRTEIEDTSRNISGARYNLMALDYDELDRAIVNAHNAVDQVEADQAAGRNQQALDRAREIRSALADINQRIASAVVARKN
jgi:hypothetical protein